MSQVRGNYNNHVAIILRQTPKNTSYIELTAAGPAISDTTTGNFEKVFYKQLQYSAKDAALRFLKASIRAFSFNEKAVCQLKEIIMSHDISVEEQAVVDQASTPTEAQEATIEKREERAKKARAARPKKDPADYKPRGFGVGAFARECIAAGKTNAEILAEVKEKWPNAKTSAASLAWYRNDLKKKAA